MDPSRAQVAGWRCGLLHSHQMTPTQSSSSILPQLLTDPLCLAPICSWWGRRLAYKLQRALLPPPPSNPLRLLSSHCLFPFPLLLKSGLLRALQNFPFGRHPNYKWVYMFFMIIYGHLHIHSIYRNTTILHPYLSLIT